MIENEIYYYVNGFLKWNISTKTSYIIENKNFFGKIKTRKKKFGNKKFFVYNCCLLFVCIQYRLFICYEVMNTF